MRQWLPANPVWLPEATILLVRSGSRAYGTARPGSDLDVRGVAIPPRRVLRSFVQRFEQVQTLEPCDLVVYELRKFFRLAAACNPGMLELLFAEDDDVLAATAVGERLRAHRQLFLTRRARKTFAGYAASQLKRLQSKRTADEPLNAKQAMHLVRLLRMCREILSEGVVRVRRPDAAELLEISAGGWSFAQLLDYAQAQEAAFDALEAASSLPADPDTGALDSLCVSLIDEHLGD